MYGIDQFGLNLLTHNEMAESLIPYMKDINGAVK